MKKTISAYLTVYLSLILGVLVSLSLAMIEGVRLSTLQLEAVCIADIGMDSVMAEYHRELFGQFNLLALDTSYGTGTVGRQNTEAHLAAYLEKNMSGKAEETVGGFSELFYRDFLKLRLEDAEVTQVSILTDGNGAVFRGKAIEAVQDDLGITMIREVLQWMQTVEEYELDTRDVAAEKREADEQIASFDGKEIEIAEDEWETINVQNPTEELEKRRESGILNQVLGEEGTLSRKKLNSEGLIRERIKNGKVNAGNVEVDEKSSEGVLNRLWFQEYLMRYLGCYTAPHKGTALDYELEYVIAGKEADADNLQSVLIRLEAMREAANAAYLFSDEAKCAEADLVALGISLLLLTPELKEPLKIALLLGWAYAESVYDVKTLLGGGRVPLLKSKESWHYDLTSILADLWGGESDLSQGEGLSYQDYLRILLFLTNSGEMTVRAMNMVEADIRMTPGNKAFRLDGCYVELESRITIDSGYGYRQVIQTGKKY